MTAHNSHDYFYGFTSASVSTSHYLTNTANILSVMLAISDQTSRHLSRLYKHVWIISCHSTNTIITDVVFCRTLNKYNLKQSECMNMGISSWDAWLPILGIKF